MNSVFLTIILVILIKISDAERTKDRMYENIGASKACFRRLNATHQIGCSSKRGGSTGVIHYCEHQTDLEFILNNGTAAPYAPIIPTKLFTPANLNLLIQSNKVSGLLLYATREELDSFTHEYQCPNMKSSLSNTCPKDKVWNPHGTGLLYQDIPFPIFYVETEETIEFAKQCFEKHNNYSFETQSDRSLCSLQLNSFMYATTNSSTCIRRSNAVTNLNPVKFCDPLGDQNVWASLFPLVKPPNYTEPIKNYKYIIVAARLDTTSMFEKTAGAASPVTGLVTLLATAKLLKTMLPERYFYYKKNILFVLFNGETYDYMGSQRFLYELLNGHFPVKSGDFLPSISADDIDLFIELSQLSHPKLVVAHYLRSSEPSKFLLTLNKYVENGTDFDKSEGTLPPASLHTFLKNRTDLPSLVLADHRTEYYNQFYNSIYDNASNINYKYNSSEDGIQTHIQEVSTMLARSLCHEITQQTCDSDPADIQFIDELFHCYLEDANCKIHQAIQQLKLQRQPLSLYVGVEIANNLITKLIGLTLAWVTGEISGEGNLNCTNEPKNYAIHYYNFSSGFDEEALNKTMCYRVTMNFTEAVSPAFIIKDYDWSSGLYSTWTESSWGDIKLRIFLKPSAAHEKMTIAIGSVVFILSTLFVYFVKSRSDILFAPQLPTLAPTNC